MDRAEQRLRGARGRFNDGVVFGRGYGHARAASEPPGKILTSKTKKKKNHFKFYTILFSTTKFRAEKSSGFFFSDLSLRRY